MKFRLAGLLIAGFLCSESLRAIMLNEWRFRQFIDAPAPGLIRVKVPPETLNAAHPDLPDVRILDSAGREVSYLIDRPMPRRESALRSQDLITALEPTATRITLTTGTRSVLKGVTFETSPGPEFIKAVAVEGSHNGTTWLQLATGKPIFRMTGGGANRGGSGGGPATARNRRGGGSNCRIACAQHRNGRKQPPAMAERRNAEFFQVVVAQGRQQVGADIIFPEGRLVLLQSQLSQEIPDIHRRTRGPSRWQDGPYRRGLSSWRLTHGICPTLHAAD